MHPQATSQSADARRTRRCQLLVGLGGGVLVAYWIATIANVNDSLLNLTFTVLIILVLPVAWSAAVAASGQLRRFIAIAAAALSCQVIGTALWYIAYLNRTSTSLPTLGFWSPPLYLALLLAAAAATSIVRGLLRPRDAVLDYSVVVAAVASVAYAVIAHHLRTVGWSAQTVDALVRPLLSLLIVVLIASAMLSSWQGLPLSVGLTGLCLLFDAAGLLCASYFESRGAYTNDRWPDLLWCTAAVIGLVAALTIVGRMDRPLKLSREALPGVNPLRLVTNIAIAWTIAGAVVVHGALTADTPALIGGVLAAAWIGIAAMLRTSTALSETRWAYRRLDEAHFSLEQARDRADELVAQRDAVIGKLEQRNVELTAVQTMLGPMLDIANERSNGQLRSNLEEAAEDLTAWLPLNNPPSKEH